MLHRIQLLAESSLHSPSVFNSIQSISPRTFSGRVVSMGACGERGGRRQEESPKDGKPERMPCRELTTAAPPEQPRCLALLQRGTGIKRSRRDAPCHLAAVGRRLPHGLAKGSQKASCGIRASLSSRCVHAHDTVHAALSPVSRHSCSILLGPFHIFRGSLRARRMRTSTQRNSWSRACTT